MSERPLILLGVQGSQHLAVPAVRGCDTDAFCDLTEDNLNLTPVDFTSTYGTTEITTTDGTGGRGDEPKTSVGGESLDLFTTSCSMGDHSKRNLLPDDNGRLYTEFDTTFVQTLCSTPGVCGSTSFTSDTCTYATSDARPNTCNAKIAEGLGKCEYVKYTQPDGYEYHNSQICDMKNISDFTIQNSNVDDWLPSLTNSGDPVSACSYNYRKNWDDIFWETPGEIYDNMGEWRFRQSLFNDNNIPIKRMECCIGHHILEDGTVDMDSSFDYNECPVDTTRYAFGNHGTANGSVDGIAADNHDYDDKIRAYVPESLMCDGRSSRAGGIELTKTPQHWCTYNMRDGFDITN